MTLEDLLRLKRTERPSTEFWVQFDRELRAKQLAALVEKRPWWSVGLRTMMALSRYHIPIGAAAILALSVVSIHEFRSVSPVRIQAPEHSRSGSAAIAVAARGDGSAAIEKNMDASLAGTSETSDLDTSLARTTDLALDSSASSLANPTQGSAFDAAVESAPVESDIPSGPRLIGDKLLSKQQVAFVREVAGPASGFESRVMPVRTPKVDPLAQMTSPTVARSNWMLNSALTSAYSAPPVRTADRSVRRPSNDRIYDDTVSRIDAHANSLGLRF